MRFVISPPTDPSAESRETVKKAPFSIVVHAIYKISYHYPQIVYPVVKPTL
jgi:hypothetical protein